MSEVRLGSRGLGEVDFAGERSSRDVFFVIVVDDEKKGERCCGRRYVVRGTEGTVFLVIFFSYGSFVRNLSTG